MNLWIFDVDGVLSNLSEKTTDHEILRHIASLLKNGDAVALNTGRSFTTIEETVIQPLEKLIIDKTHLKNMFIVCEMGNVLGSFKDGSFHKQILDDPILPELSDQIREIVEKDFSAAMFFDETKETMLSIEIKDGFDLEIYKKAQDIIHEKITALLLSNKYLQLNLVIGRNPIAIDIQYEDAGKHLGAERIEDWMMANNIKPEKIYMLGDSPSDSKMAEELQNTYSVIFVFVGEKEKLDTDKLMCEIIYTKEKYNKGTLEFLTSHIT